MFRSNKIVDSSVQRPNNMKCDLRMFDLLNLISDFLLGGAAERRAQGLRRDSDRNFPTSLPELPKPSYDPGKLVIPMFYNTNIPKRNQETPRDLIKSFVNRRG